MRNPALHLGGGGAKDAFLPAVEDLLRAAVAPRDGRTPGLLVEASRNLVLAPGGKRLRPRLVMLAGRSLRRPDHELVLVAAAAELMHGASLLHDDVIDDGRDRRGRPTANALWGNARAVLAGDWLLTRALERLAGLPRALTSEAISTAAEMTCAAVAEIEARGRTDLTLEDWRAIAEGKTGALFGWCGSAPSLLARRPDAARAFDVLGRRLGVAFQMADDLRDVCQTDARKDRCSDIRSRTPSSVSILAMAHVPALRERIGCAWSTDPVPDALVEEVSRAIRAHRIDAVVRRLLASEIEGALAALERSGTLTEALPDLRVFARSLLAGLP